MRIDEKTDARGIAKKGKGGAAKGIGGASTPLFAGRLSAVAKASAEYQGEPFGGGDK